MKKRSEVSILIADDDQDDCQMIKEALAESRLVNELKFVHDGQELLNYLNHCDPLPGLILLDLNMPKMDGREALKEIKNDSRFRQIPIVVFTTSKAEEDVYRTYSLGVNSFITKPVTFESLVSTMRALGRYWFEIVVLPSERDK